MGNHCASRALVTICLIGTPLALGGVHTSTTALVTLLMFVVAVIVWHHNPFVIVTPITLLVSLAACVSLLQLVPLPLGAHAFLSQTAHTLFSLTPNTGNGWHPISMDLPATAGATAQLLLYGLATLLATQIYVEKKQQELLLVIACAGALVFIVGVGHFVFGLSQTYGSFGPRHSGLISSFINPNHLAGFLGMGSLAALVLALDPSHRHRRALILVAVATGCGVLLTYSRAGMVAYLTTLALTGPLTMRLQTHWLKRCMIPIAIITCALGAFFTHEAITEVENAGGTTSLLKVDLWGTMPRIVADFPIAGIGRGAFKTVFARYNNLAPQLTFTHIENEWLQVIIDFGIPIAGLLLITLLWRFMHIISTRHRGNKDAIVPLLFLGLHNLADFNLSTTAIGLPAVMLFATIDPCLWRISITKGTKIAGGLLLATALIGCSAYAMRFDASTDEKQLKTKLGDTTEAKKHQAAVHATIARHPADTIMPSLIARVYLTTGRPHLAMPWINRAMWLAPFAATPHQLAGFALLQLGKIDQGILEYRLASDAAPDQSGTMARVAWQITQNPSVVARIASDSIASRQRVAGVLMMQGAYQAARQLMHEPLDLWGRGLLANIQSRSGLHDEATITAKQLLRADPTQTIAYHVLATSLLATEKQSEALVLLRQGAQIAQQPVELNFRRVQILRDMGHLTEASALLKQNASSIDSPQQLALADFLYGTILLKKNNHEKAISFFKSSIKQAPMLFAAYKELIRTYIVIGKQEKALALWSKMHHRGFSKHQLEAVKDFLPNALDKDIP